MIRASGQRRSVTVGAAAAAVVAEIAGQVVVAARRLRAGQGLAEVCGGLLCSRLAMRWPAGVGDRVTGTRCCIER